MSVLRYKATIGDRLWEFAMFLIVAAVVLAVVALLVAFAAVSIAVAWWAMGSITGWW